VKTKHFNIRIVTNLEDYCLSGEFTDAVNEFIQENCGKMEESQEDEHSLV
jgi:hypothetical protein